MKKRNLIIAGSSIITIMVIALAILGYSMTQGNIVSEKEIAKESEPYSEENVDNEICYVKVEENEESKLNSIKAKEMAKSSAGVTIQQGNIVVSVNKNFTVDEAILNEYNKHYRTEYGIGETIVVKVYFDKEIKTVNNASLYLKFGNGAERKATTIGINGSELIFNYTIAKDDNGELKLTNLSGEVIDYDDNSIRIGLSQSGSIQYQDSSVIIAKTARAQRTQFASYFMGTSNEQIHVEMTYNEYVYVKTTNNKLIKLTNDNMKDYIHIKIRYR